MKNRSVAFALLMSTILLSISTVPTLAGTLYGRATITRAYNPTGESNKWWLFDEVWTGTVTRGSAQDWTGDSGTLDLAGASISVHFVSKVHKDTLNGFHEGEVAIVKGSVTITGTIRGMLESGNFIEGRWVVNQNTKGFYHGWKTCTFVGPGETWDIHFFPDGFDEYGYNYGANLFVGTYDSADRKLDGAYWGQTGDWVDDKLIMKWSDNWEPAGNPGLNPELWSGAWLTNHVEGDYTSEDGQVHHYTSFTKIVYTGPGSPLWGYFSIIEDVYNDPYGGFHGVQTLEPPAGLGH